MKRIFILIAVIMAVGMLAPRYSGAANNPRYYVSLSTYAINGTTETFALGGYPNIAGKVKVRKLILANSADALQSITFYENVTDTSTGTAFMTVVLSTASSTDRTKVIDFKANMFYGAELELKNLAVTKSSTASDIHMTVLYGD